MTNRHAIELKKQYMTSNAISHKIGYTSIGYHHDYGFFISSDQISLSGEKVFAFTFIKVLRVLMNKMLISTVWVSIMILNQKKIHQSNLRY